MNVNSSGDGFGDLEAKYIREFRDGVWDMASGVAAVMQQIAPVDTGTFRASIQVEPESPRQSPLVVVFSDVEYAIFLEYGTVFMDAQPTFRPAYEKTRQENIRYLAARLGRVA